MPYTEIEQKLDTTASPGRDRLYVTIVPSVNYEKANQADLISTAIQAAFDYHKKVSAPVTVINVLSQNTGNNYADRPIAFIVYIPDQKGYDGKQETKIWEQATASNRGFTADELTYLRLWGELREKYINPLTGGVTPDREEFLEAEIEQTMGKKLNENPMLNIMWDVNITQK